MRVTQGLYSRGFLGRSFEEFARLSGIAFKLEAVKGPSGPRSLYEFNDKDAVSRCIAMSDDLIGGSSITKFDFVSSPSSQKSTSSSSSPSSDKYPSPSAYARFHGTISTALPEDKHVVKRSGYAAFKTPDQPPTLFGRSVWDIDPYSFLAMRIKSDGRSYFINVQTDGVEPTDLHQHRLFAKNPGQWETVLVNWNDFVRTSYGFVVEPQTELLRQKVKTIGIGLTDRVEGPFELCIEKIWATNEVEDGYTAPRDGDAAEPDAASLRNKKGEKIQW